MSPLENLWGTCPPAPSPIDAHGCNIMYTYMYYHKWRILAGAQRTCPLPNFYSTMFISVCFIPFCEVSECFKIIIIGSDSIYHERSSETPG